MQEEKLDFGAVSSAVKIGETVHRNSGAWTPTIHALLRFLAERDFKYSPRPLGIDEKGREVLTFLPGQAAIRPWPPVVRKDTGLIQAARVLRNYHEIVKDFKPAANAEWRIGKVKKTAGQIIRHGDIGPWNTIWHNERITAIIDWDFAEPGNAITDLAQMAYYFVPLRGESGWRQAGFSERPDFSHRLNVLCRAYGRFTVGEVLAELEQYLHEELRRLRELGGNRVEPWLNFLGRGEDKEILSDIDWLRKDQQDNFMKQS